MGKDPTKPRGKMSSYAYFVQTCREEHKKKHPDTSVNFSEFSKKCSERWKVVEYSVCLCLFVCLFWIVFTSFMCFFSRQCQPRRKASSKIWPDLTRRVMSVRWRTMFLPEARRRRGLRTLMPPRDPRNKTLCFYSGLAQEFLIFYTISH